MAEMRQNPKMPDRDFASKGKCLNIGDHAKCFFKLICKPHIREFLHMDNCCAIIDKYVLVGVFIYFVRANFRIEEYSTRNFYIALYLFHEIYEEVNSLKFEIVSRCLGQCILKSNCVRKFDEDRFYLLQRMNFHVLYDKKHCDLILSRFPHVVWYRRRSDDHAGVIINENITCRMCCLPVIESS